MRVLHITVTALLCAAGTGVGCAFSFAGPSGARPTSSPMVNGPSDEVGVIEDFSFLPKGAAAPELAELAAEIEAWKEHYMRDRNLDYALWIKSRMAPLWGGRTVFAAPPERYRVRGETEVVYPRFGASTPLTLWRWVDGVWRSDDITVPGQPDVDGSTSDFLVCVDPSDRRSVVAVFDLREPEPVLIGQTQGLSELSISPSGTWIGFRQGQRVGGIMTAGALSQTFAAEPLRDRWSSVGSDGDPEVAWLGGGRAAICDRDTLIDLPSGNRRALGDRFGQLRTRHQRPLTDQVLASRDGSYLLHRFGPDLRIVETERLTTPRKDDRISSVSPTTEHFALRTSTWRDFLPGSWGQTAVCRRNDGRLEIEASVHGMSTVIGWMSRLEDRE